MNKAGYRLRAIGLFFVLFWLLNACVQSPFSVPVVHSPLLGAYSFTPFPNHRSSGALVLADTGLPTSPNPLFASSRFDLELLPALWAAPVVFDNQFHVQADQLTEVPLPENGDVQDGGKTIVMHLRHDLRWSDGQPVLANDFAYWWRLNQDPNSGAITTSGYDQIASITTPDPFTVVLHMKRPFGPYLSYLPYAAPEHAWSRWAALDLQNQPAVFQAPAVTDGPYRLALFSAQQGYTLVPNPGYHSTTFHGAFLSQLFYRAYSTASALNAAVQSGQVDVAEGYAEDMSPLPVSLPATMRLLSQPAAAYEHLDFNLSRPLFQDARVRQAIQLALDRCAILRYAVGAPDCARETDQVEPLPSLVYDSSIHSPPYDSQHARQLLAEAGWTSVHGQLSRQGQPFAVRLVTTSGSPERAAVATRIKQGLEALGIQVKIAFYDLGTFFGVYSRAGILATGAYDLALFGYANAPEPDDEYAVFHSSQIPDATQPDLGNYGHVADPLIDQALTQGRATVAFSARVQAYHRFLERLASQVYLIPLYTDLNQVLINPRLKNVSVNPNIQTTNWNIADWWLVS